MSSAGPSRPQRPPSTASPLPQPIRRAVRAAQPATQPIPSKANPQAAQTAQPVNPRAKSLFGSFKALTPNTRIVIGLVGITVGLSGLFMDRFVLPEKGEEKPLISVRTVDRE